MEKALQTKLIKLLSEGNTANEISAITGTPKKTVEKHIELMKFFYGAKNVVHLVVIYLKLKK